MPQTKISNGAAQFVVFPSIIQARHFQGELTYVATMRNVVGEVIYE